MSRIFTYFAKNIRKCSWNDASISVPLSTACDRESLSRPRLAIGKYGSIITRKAALDHVLHHLLKNTLLLSKHIKNAVEFKHVVLSPCLLILKAILLNVKLYLVFISVYLQLLQVRFLGGPNPNKHLNAILRFSFFWHFEFLIFELLLMLI